MKDESLPVLLDEFRVDIPAHMRKENITGLSVAIVDADGTLWEAGFGVADKTRPLPVTARTMFSLQSCSKTFTATAVMLAVQDGLLSLDTPIREYLPGFTLQSRFEQHPEDIITLRHLLSHKAGFTHEAPVGNNKDWHLYPGDYCARGSVIANIIKVYRHKGYLYLSLRGGKLKLEEHQPGLFFTMTGEAVDFTDENPIFAGVSVQKIGLLTKLRFGIILIGTFFRLWGAKFLRNRRLDS